MTSADVALLVGPRSQGCRDTGWTRRDRVFDLERSHLHRVLPAVFVRDCSEVAPPYLLLRQDDVFDKLAKEARILPQDRPVLICVV